MEANDSMTDAVYAFFQRIGDFLSNYVKEVSQLPALWRSDQQTFFMIAGSLFVLLFLLILLVVLLSRRKKQPAQSNLRNQGKAQRRFIPVESSGSDLDAIFLPLDERIVSCGKALTPDVIERIKKKSPKSLADIVSAFSRATPSLKTDLSRIVREMHMMEAYSRRLDREDYPQGVLVDAWHCFPDETILRSFVELLASKDERTQMSAVRLLAAMHEPKCLPMLVLALIRPDRYLTARVAEVFVSLPAESAALLSYMLPEIDDKHKESVLEIIAQTGAKFDPTNVIACLKHSSYHIRVAAAQALGACSITDAVSHLMLTANDKRWQVRAATAKALGMIGDSRAITVLDALTHDTEGWVASSAKESLELFRKN